MYALSSRKRMSKPLEEEETSTVVYNCLNSMIENGSDGELGD